MPFGFIVEAAKGLEVKGKKLDRSCGGNLLLAVMGVLIRLSTGDGLAAAPTARSYPSVKTI
jgi:hypothetical protein